MVTYEQINLFDLLESDNTKEQVKLTDICKYSKGTLSEYEVPISYSDTVLLISMLHDYIKMLDNLQGSRIEYYKTRFEAIAETMEKSIDYNYMEKLEKCKSTKPDKDDRLGENWIGS